MDPFLFHGDCHGDTCDGRKNEIQQAFDIPHSGVHAAPPRHVRPPTAVVMLDIAILGLGMFAAYEEEAASSSAHPPVTGNKADDGLQYEGNGGVF
jgi:hypothetical protein